jgi:CHAT domain/Ternary complex associated domain 7
MPAVTRHSGLRVDVPGAFEIVDLPSAPVGPRARRRAGPAGRLPRTEPGSPDDVLLRALADQDLEVYDDVGLQPRPVARRRAPGPPSGPQVATFELEMEAHEQAVLLTEQDGLYTWHFPAGEAQLASPPRRRGVPAEPTRKRVSFQVDVSVAAPPMHDRTRGALGDLVLGRVRAIVLKFAARVAVGKLMAYLERNVREGLVAVGSTDLGSWRPIDPGAVRLRGERPLVLLLLHGTFSSTVGSFGSLCGYDWGRRFLADALDTYDAVLGIDHRTLSKDPLENATDLLAQLKALDPKGRATYDAVAYSRGALVLRTLTERLLPLEQTWRPTLGSAAFVAGANGGTELAKAHNWTRLVDLYTNLAVLAARALGLIPQAALVATVLRELVQSLGALVKYIAIEGTGDRVPGLAAMNPDGTFVRDLNQTQPGQPTPGSILYYAITSSFESRLFGDQPSDARERLVLATADHLVDQLMTVQNDLVVDVASMTEIDPRVGGFVLDRLALGDNPSVYHTVYFHQPQVVEALAGWLRLAVPAKPDRPPSRATRGPGTMVTPEFPAVVATDVMIVDAADSVAVVRGRVDAERPSHVILEDRSRYPRLLYAYQPDELLAYTRVAAPDAGVKEALGLHESDASPRVGRNLEPPPQQPHYQVVRGAPAPNPDRRIVIEAGEPIGVIRDVNPLSSTELAAMERRARRASGKGSPGTGRRAPTRPGSAAPPILAHFHASMDPEVVVDEVTSVQVIVSRKELHRAAGRASAAGQGDVDESRPIIIQLIPQTNVQVEGNSRVEIPVPAPGQPPQLVLFDVRPTHIGNGEVWVVGRQGQIPIVTLVLRPLIVKDRSAHPLATLTTVESDAAAPQALARPLNVLRIWETEQDGQAVYMYDLEAPDLELLAQFSSRPIVGDRAQYVRSRYRQIEQRWVEHKDDAKAFQEELRAFGGELLDELIPRELQKLLWVHRDKLDQVMVLAKEPFIPWELVHLKQPDAERLPRQTAFLGQHGLVRWLHGSWPPDRLRLRPGKARYIVPSYPDPRYALPETEQERAFLEQRLHARPVVPHQQQVLNLIKRPGSFDILHFAGHGLADSMDITDAQLLLEGRMEYSTYVQEPLRVALIRQNGALATRDGGRPLIVLNACQTGRLGYQLSSIGGFARAFLGAGAGAFISSLWSVGDTPARAFVEAFYDGLLKGRTVADATSAAREEARAAGDATWLAYTVYAHPSARLDRPNGTP